jgi:hypothetical protein
MRRALLSVSASAIAIIVLAGCTAPAPEPSPTASQPPAASGSTSTGLLPTCAAIGDAIVAITSGLVYDETVSTAQTADEAYDQRVCVFVTEDGATQVGVTIATIPFLQEELDAYATLPGAIADERLGDSGAVLQTLDAADREDGHLDSALYLFDTTHSITVQGYSTAGDIATLLPGLSVAAATDAAFAVRALL